jgi:hypothetical protein
MTQNELKELINYDQDTGIFTWIKSRPGVHAGNQAGTINNYGYAVITVNKKLYRAHRLAWLYVYGINPKDQIDHINGNRSDNKITNLREVNNNQNQFNSKIRKDNTSGVKGVVWRPANKKWQARIRVNNISKSLGYFEDLELARLAISEARIKYHGIFARHK